MIDTIAIHRGRNSKSTEICKSITSIDYNFDFRGFYGGSILNPFWLLLKAWITSREIPEAKNYFIEGGMLFWVGFFLKKRYPRSKLLVMVPEPAFYFDKRKSFIQKKFFKFRIAMMRRTVGHYFFISKMVADDAIRLLGNDISYSMLRHYVANMERFVFNDYENKDNNILFVIERPNDTGYVKGLNQAVEIFEDVQKDMPNAKLILAGSGTEHLKFENKSIVGLGHCNIEEVYKNTKILIAPAVYDAFPLVVPEASLSGVVPLVSNNVGSQEFLPKELILNLENIQEWSSKIKKILKYSSKEVNDLLSKPNEEFRLLTKDNIIGGFKKDYKKHMCQR